MFGLWKKKWSRIRGIARPKDCVVLLISPLFKQNLPPFRALSAHPYVRVSNPHASSNRSNSLAATFVCHEKVERRAYKQRNSGRWSTPALSPAIFSTTGGMGKHGASLYKRIASSHRQDWGAIQNHPSLHPLPDWLYFVVPVCLFPSNQFNILFVCLYLFEFGQEPNNMKANVMMATAIWRIRIKY